MRASQFPLESGVLISGAGEQQLVKNYTFVPVFSKISELLNITNLMPKVSLNYNHGVNSHTNTQINTQVRN